MSRLQAAHVVPGAHAVQGTLALDLEGARTLQVPGPPETPELTTDHKARVEHVADAELRAWAARFAQASIETLAGHRPVSQLIRWTIPSVYRELERRHRLVNQVTGPRGQTIRPQVRSVHLCQPAADVVEASVHVRHGQRSRAVAMRLERRNGRWVCTVLEFV